MPSIDIDFETFKALTARRKSESHSLSDVVRELAGLPTDQQNSDLPAGDDGGWTSKGVHFPEGTALRAIYKGREYMAVVERGGLVVDGKRSSSLSNAAMMITKTNVDGWKFWHCRFPGTATWRSVASLRSVAQG